MFLSCFRVFAALLSWHDGRTRSSSEFLMVDSCLCALRVFVVEDIFVYLCFRGGCSRSIFQAGASTALPSRTARTASTM
jgi:hypothetical protein